MTAAQDPLAGRMVLVTRTRERAGGIVDLLHARGARVVVVPLISTVPLLHPEAIAEAAAALGRAPGPRWAVFTSATAVRLVLSAVSPEPLPTATLVVCIGPQTAAEARREGLTVGAVALVPTAAGVVDALAGRLGALHSLR